MKCLKKTALLLLILFLWVLLVLTAYRYWLLKYHYTYLSSVKSWDYRYSLYENTFIDGSQWIIFEHNISYKNYKKVERSKISFFVYNNNPHDKFIYYIYSDEVSRKRPKIEIINQKYLVMSIDWIYHFLYDIKKKATLFNLKVNNIFDEIKENSHSKSSQKELFIKWKKNNLHKEIENIIYKDI